MVQEVLKPYRAFSNREFMFKDVQWDFLEKIASNSASARMEQIVITRQEDASVERDSSGNIVNRVSETEVPKGRFPINAHIPTIYIGDFKIYHSCI